MEVSTTILENAWRLISSNQWQNQELGKAAIEGMVNGGVFPAIGSAMEAIMNHAAQSTKTRYDLEKYLDRYKISGYTGDEKCDVAFIMDCHFQYNKDWRWERNGVMEHPEILYLDDHEVFPYLGEIKRLVDDFNANIAGIVADMVKSVDKSNAAKVGSMLHLYQVSTSKLTKHMGYATIDLPSNHDIWRELRDAGVFGEPPFKKGDYVHYQDRLWFVTSDSIFCKSYNSAHMYWSVRAISVKASGEPHGKRGCSPYDSYEWNMEFIKTDISEWEWCKNRRDWVLKEEFKDKYSPKEPAIWYGQSI